MSITTVLDALALPIEAKVDQRIPKKLLVEQGAATASDKRQLQNGIEELMWVAALKPTNIGVPSFLDSEREYLEIAVLTVDIRPGAKVARLLELIHRAVPYPVLLLASFLDAGETCIGISTGHKRFNQNEVGKFVVDEVLTTYSITPSALFSTSVQSFLGALSLSVQPNKDLFALYQGWVNCIIGLSVAGVTGPFVLPSSPEQTRHMREFMKQRSHILIELSALRAEASKEKQMNRLVELNISIKRLESQLAANQSTLLAL